MILDQKKNLIGNDTLPRACEGGPTAACRMGAEHAQQCLACLTKVRVDMVDHPFFGFAAGCSQHSTLRSAPLPASTHCVEGRDAPTDDEAAPRPIVPGPR